MNPVVDSDHRSRRPSSGRRLQPGGLMTALLAAQTGRTTGTSFHAALSTWDVARPELRLRRHAGQYRLPGHRPVADPQAGHRPGARWTAGPAATTTGPASCPTTRCRRVYNPPRALPRHGQQPRRRRPTTRTWSPPTGSPGYRAERITQMIQAKPKLTMDDIKAMQYDTHSVRGGEGRAVPGRADRRRRAHAAGRRPVQELGRQHRRR